MCIYSYSISGLRKVIENVEPRARRVLVVGGRRSLQQVEIETALRKLRSKYDLMVADGFGSNPSFDVLAEGLKSVEAFDPDLVVGIGGGSCLDYAKLISVFLSQTLEEVYEAIKKNKVTSNRKVRLITIPTTAGSGSEATQFAVCYLENKKYSVDNASLLPAGVVLDPTLLRTAPHSVKVNSGLDAMAQAIESAWARSATDESQHWSFEALEKIKLNFVEFLYPKSNFNPDTAARNMLHASHLAGKAINCTRTTAPHAWSYGFTTHYGFSHGHAVWMTLPRVYQLHAKASLFDSPTSQMKKLRRAMVRLNNALNLDSNYEFCLKKFVEQLGVNLEFQDNNLELSDRLKLSKEVNRERMINNPIELGTTEVNWVFDL